ncbi:hypothetical protein [Alkaliphilus crotonatoxidans]
MEANNHFMYPPMEDFPASPYPMSPMMAPMGDMGYFPGHGGMPGCYPPVSSPCPQMPMPSPMPLPTPMPMPMPSPMPMPMPPGIMPLPDHCMPEDAADHMKKMYYMHMYMAAMHKAEAYKHKMMHCDHECHKRDEDHC